LLQRLIPDRFILVLSATIVFASFAPLPAKWNDMGQMVAGIAIFFLFFLHGLRLSRADVVRAASDWRLQGLIALFVFGIMPLSGLAASIMAGPYLPAGLVIGIIFAGILPTTVQSAISYCSIAGGNIAASVIASALLNLSAIIVTPLLLILLSGSALEGSGAELGPEFAIKIFSILLLPFSLGQMMQRWLGEWASRRSKMLGIMDKAAIAMAVYIAFGSAVAGGLWQVVDISALLIIIMVATAMLVVAFGGSWLVGTLTGLGLQDRIALMFSGSHKSIATGAPMAALLFPGQEGGMVILPALVYHLLQLIISAPLANRLNQHGETTRKMAL
jgi:sodium/bile acid cotransporter 7